MTKLEHALRAVQVLQAVLTQVLQRRALGQALGHEVGRGVAHEHLAAVSAGAQPGAANHGLSEVVALVAQLRLAGVQRDSHTELVAHLARQAPLCVARGRNRVGWREKAATIESPSPCSTGRTPPQRVTHSPTIS